MATTFRVPSTGSQLVACINEMISGVRAFGADLDLPPGFEAALVGDRDRYIRLAREFNEMKAAESAAVAARNTVERDADTFLWLVFGIMRPRIGTRANREWECLGLPPRSCAKPRTTADRLNRLSSTYFYLTENPAYEVPALDLTAARANELLELLQDSVGAVQAAIANSGVSKVARDEALEKLAVRGRYAASTLATVLSASDERWLAFGLRRPIDVRVPAPAAEPQLAQIAPGKIEVRVERPARSKRIRIFVQESGETEPRHLETIRETVTVLSGIRAGELKIRVSGANGTGEGRMSNPASIVVEPPGRETGEGGD